MKHFFAIAITLLLSATIYAQDSLIIRNKWSFRKDSQIVFVGANNVIEIYGKGFNAKEAKLKSMDKGLRLSVPEVKGDTLVTWAMPYATGRKMKVEVVDAQTGKSIKETVFYGQKLPELLARAGSIKSDTATRQQLQDQYALRAIFPNCSYSYPYRITQYKFKTHYGSKNVSMQVNDAVLAPAVMEAIKELPPNTMVEFTDIKAICPQCEPHAIPDLKLFVK